GDWLEIRSPYSGEIVGRVAKGGTAEAKRAVDAAAAALENPLPAHKRAEILVKDAGAIGRRHEEVARTICEEAGKPIKTARVEASRASSTYTLRALRADPRRARAGSVAAGRRADRRRRRVVGVGGRRRRGASGQVDHVHGLRHRSMEARRALVAQAREARARQLDDRDRRVRRRHR